MTCPSPEYCAMNGCSGNRCWSPRDVGAYTPAYNDYGNPEPLDPARQLAHGLDVEAIRARWAAPGRKPDDYALPIALSVLACVLSAAALVGLVLL